MAKKILFVGNGFNLLSDNGASWNDLLDDLAGKPLTKHDVEVRNAKPFTLWFEEILARSRKTSPKQYVSEVLKRGLAVNSFHQELMGLKYNHILTTNYEYSLESVASIPWKSDSTARESRYSLFRRTSVGDKHIWHIHGELNNSDSIMLGHHHYSGYIHKILSYLTHGVPTEAKSRKKRPYRSRFNPYYSEGKKFDDIESWVDLFLGSEVHIVGFGLDYTEQDIWYLITKKLKIRKKRSSIGGVVYHWCSNDLPNSHDEAKFSILESLGVKVKKYGSDSYESSYKMCINQLSRL